MRYMNGMALEKDRSFQMRVTDDWLAQIDDWRAKHRNESGIPSRAEAIRLLVAAGLKVLGKK